MRRLTDPLDTTLTVNLKKCGKDSKLNLKKFGRQIDTFAYHESVSVPINIKYVCF